MNRRGRDDIAPGHSEGSNGVVGVRSAGASSSQSAAASASQKFAIQPPAISLPKGGGAVRGIGEKFAANPVTGTASMTIPIGASPGRGGFGPELSLSYDSGSGNGPFGFGWSLSLPSITRKTDKGLPVYYDAGESDIYVLSGAEDLVPLPGPEGARFEETRDGYTIHRYRPRLEGLFARIERWTHRATGEIHWRSISRENVTTFYGRTNESRIFDPDDPRPDHPTRIFTWLISESYDDKGNVIVYEYAGENDAGIDRGQSNERNRVRTANRYLKSVKYGNQVSRFVEGAEHWLFQLVFDYDEGRLADVPRDPSRPVGEQHARVEASFNATHPWASRPDAFSAYRAGFEVRTYRRCRRILMFHDFPELTENQAGEPCLVRATELDYADLGYDAPVSIDAELEHQGSTRFASFIRSVTQSGFVRDEARAVGERDSVRYVTYLKRSLPPLEFDYSKAVISDEVRELDTKSLENLPRGLDDGEYRWVDLDGEGLSGMLAEQGGGWFYKPNLGDGRFGPMRVLPRKPTSGAIAAGAQQLVDLSGDGELDVVAFEGPTPGFFERTRDENWQPFKTFRQLPRVSFGQPNVRLVDLDGDGHADALITEDEVFTWYPSLGEGGFAEARRVRQPLDEERGPRLVLGDGTQSIYLADLCGDGLTDLVRIRNGEVCYWPNLGYGRFGPKVTMDNSPWFDRPDEFDQRRVRLADIDGSGTNDIIYLHRDGIRIYFNQSGNRLSEARRLAQLPSADNLASVMTADLFGNGTACLVWSSPLPAHARSPIRYIDLMGGQKPHLLISTRNHLGAETEVEYASSTRFYLADKLAGTPWITKLPFPVHCLARVTVSDRFRQTRFSTTYSYHHGYFDGAEREFRGFGRVDQVDAEAFGVFAAGNVASPYITDDRQLYQPPIKTVTWYHTGAMLDREPVLSQFEREYFPHSFEASNPDAINVLGGFRENVLPEPDLDADRLNPIELREAFRACKGMPLRQEIYELDVDAWDSGEERRVKLFSAAYHNCHVRRLQPLAENRHAVFLVTESEAITYHYELDLRSADIHPDPRVAHTLNLNVDELGNVLQSVAIAYPRFGRHVDPTLPDGTEALVARVQRETHLTYTETRFTNDVDAPDDHRLRVPCEIKTYELTGVSQEDESDRESSDPRDDRYFTLDELRELRLSHEYQTAGTPVEEIPYHALPHRASPQERLVEHVRTLFFDDSLSAPLPFGELNRLGLPYEAYKLALTDALLGAVLGSDRLTPEVRVALDDSRVAGYFGGSALAAVFPDAVGQYWVRSGTAGFDADAAQHFFLPERYTDPFANTTRLSFDPYDLFPASSTDALDNTVSVLSFDYRVLSPRLIRDINDNVSEALFDILGAPVAVALKGKGAEGDHLDSFDALTHPPLAVTTRLFDEAYDETALRRLLGTATVRHVYSFGEALDSDGSVTYGTRPAAACSIVRETHVADLAGDELTRLQVSFEYSDGGGNVLVKKAQAEPAFGETALRWLASGKTILNNKGKPVKQYEPYFSPNEHRFEDPPEVGVTPILYYDAPGRVIRTEQPDGSYSRVEFSPWHVTAFDANDTMLEPGNAWYAARTGADAPAEEREAAQKAAAHAGTPATVFLDSLAREVLSVAHNKFRDRRGVDHDEKYVTFTRLDAEGKPLYLRDARGNLVMQYIAPPLADGHAGDPTEGFVPCYDIAGNLLFQHSMDAGDRWMLPDAAGQPLYSWDVNDRLEDSGERVLENRIYFTRYDALRRPLEQRLSSNAGPPQTVSRLVYGDELASSSDARSRNLRGQVHQAFDPSGLVTNVRSDFKGAVLEMERRLVRDVTAPVVDWSGPTPEVLLEEETFRKRTEYDALGRMRRLVNWHRTPARTTTYEPEYNERGLLAAEDLIAGDGRRVRAVSGIRYNEKGQQERIQYGNGTITRRHFDPLTFRLRQIRTTRPDYDPPFPDHHSGLADERVVQQLHYTYDTSGNITEIHDEAYEPVFFAGQEVEACSRYTYDALYRLISATGRENSETIDAPGQLESDIFPSDFPHAPGSLRNYVEHYTYDEVGNILELAHRVPGAGAPTGSEWTRHYDPEPTNNRLRQTRLGESPIGITTYHYDLHGSMANLANVSPEFYLRWDYRDMIRAVNRGGGGWVHYSYDAEKQRTRKVITRLDGTRQWERIYLGGSELYRSYATDGTLEEEIVTDHLFVGEERTLIVDDVIATNDDELGVGVLLRYQYGNHLASVGLELDASGAIISYEEYHPYGTSAYRAPGRGVRATKKRYRYTGMERDEETGLSYHAARHFAPWLTTWASADPSWLIDGTNAYAFGRNSPARLIDVNGRQAMEPDTPAGSHGIQLPEVVIAADAPIAVRLAERATHIRGRAERESDSESRRQLELTAAFSRELSELDLGPAVRYDPTESLDAPRGVDQLTHDRLVLVVIRLALEYGRERAGSDASSWEVMREALFGLIVPVRVTDEFVGQNIVLRDADHYLTGRVAEWRRTAQDLTQIDLGAGDEFEPASVIESALGDVAAWIYDVGNAFDDPEEELAEPHPRSPRGGVHWPEMGSFDYRRYDLPNDPNAVSAEQPEPPIETATEWHWRMVRQQLELTTPLLP